MVSDFKSSKFSFFALLLIAIVFVFTKFSQLDSNPDYWKNSTPIAYDVYGYYLYLPATIIHHDPGMEDRSWIDSLNNRYRKTDPFYQAVPGQKGRLVNIYQSGLAFIWLPFFLTAHGIAGIGGYPQDGMSPPYHVLIVIAGLFYALLGIFLLRKLLLKLVSDRITAIVLLVIAFGTNLFHYATYDNAMPHIFIFPFAVLIILLTISWHENPRKRTAFFLGLTIALVTISRPSEIVWILIPIFWNVDSLSAFRSKLHLLRAHFSHLLVFAFGLILLGSVQLIYWKYTSGHWISNNHAEGFDFFRPFTLDVLFSYKKGWLLYTPVMIFAIAGLFMLYRWNKKLFIPLFLFFLINLWVISSWECWWYAASFGQRPFVQSYGMMAIPLAFLIERIRFHSLLKWSVGILLVFFTLLNQFQNWQLMHGILSPLLMTKTYYWKIFGRTNAVENAWEWMEVNRYYPQPFSEVAGNYIPHVIVNEDYENPALLKPEQILTDTFAGNPSHCELLNAEHDFTAIYCKSYEEITSRDHLRIKMECDVFIPAENFDKELNFTCNMTGNRKQVYGYNGATAQQLGAQAGKWSHVEAWYITSEILHRDDILNLQVWNSGKGNVWVDNIRYTLYEPKEK